MTRILVTGGAGFIGGHLCRRLAAEGAELVVLDDLSSGKAANIPAGARLIEGSVTDPEAVARATQGMDCCFHLAAIASVRRCIEDLAGSHRVNLGGFVGLIERLARSNLKVPVIYASSAAVYGALHDLPLHEDVGVEPLSPYGADKRGCELHARAAFEVYGLRSTGFRFFNVFGPGQDPTSPYSGVISKFADRLLHGQAPVIFGDGLQSRDFVFVDDVVEALVRAGRDQAAGAEVFNVCTGQETTIVDLALEMQQVFGRSAFAQHIEGQAGEVRRSLGDPSALERRFGFRPATTLSAGLTQLRASLV